MDKMYIDESIYLDTLWDLQALKSFKMSKSNITFGTYTHFEIVNLLNLLSFHTII